MVIAFVGVTNLEEGGGGGEGAEGGVGRKMVKGKRDMVPSLVSPAPLPTPFPFLSLVTPSV